VCANAGDSEAYGGNYSEEDGLVCADAVGSQHTGDSEALVCVGADGEDAEEDGLVCADAGGSEHTGDDRALVCVDADGEDAEDSLICVIAAEDVENYSVTSI